MFTTVTVKASELKAGDTVVDAKGTRTTLSHTVVGRKYVMLWNNVGLSLGRIGKDEEVQVERAVLVLTPDELFRVKLAMAFEEQRIRDLVAEEDTPQRQSNLRLAKGISERLSEV